MSINMDFSRVRCVLFVIACVILSDCSNNSPNGDGRERVDSNNFTSESVEKYAIQSISDIKDRIVFVNFDKNKAGVCLSSCLSDNCDSLCIGGVRDYAMNFLNSRLLQIEYFLIGLSRTRIQLICGVSENGLINLLSFYSRSNPSLRTMGDSSSILLDSIYYNVDLVKDSVGLNGWKLIESYSHYSDEKENQPIKWINELDLQFDSARAILYHKEKLVRNCIIDAGMLNVIDTISAIVPVVSLRRYEYIYWKNNWFVENDGKYRPLVN